MYFQTFVSVPKYFEDRVAVELALNGINTTILKQKFTTISAVPEVVIIVFILMIVFLHGSRLA